MTHGLPLFRVEVKLEHLNGLLSESKTIAQKEITEEEVRSFLDTALSQLQGIASDSAEKVKAEMQKRVSSIVLTPSIDANGPLYTISCDVALFSSGKDAVQANQPPVDGLHYTFPISIEVRPYRRPRGWKTKEQHASDREENEVDPILEGNESGEPQQALGSHSALLVNTDVRETSAMSVI